MEPAFITWCLKSLDNSIDEALEDIAKILSVFINPNNTITVEDDGRGIPIDIHKTEKVSAAEVIMTQFMRVENLIMTLIKFQVDYTVLEFQ